MTLAFFVLTQQRRVTYRQIDGQTDTLLWLLPALAQRRAGKKLIDVPEHHSVQFSIQENTEPAKLHKTKEQNDKHCDHSRRAHGRCHVSALLSTMLGMHLSVRLSRCGTTAVVPPPIRLGNHALCVSCPLVTPYQCKLWGLVVLILCISFFVSIIACACIFCCFRRLICPCRISFSTLILLVGSFDL